MGSFKLLVNTKKTGVDLTSDGSYKSEMSNECVHNESKLFILYYVVRNPTQNCMRRLVQQSAHQLQLLIC
jgi:hypothetical protein